MPQVRALPGVPLNASPSGHVAWVLLMFWFAGRYGNKAVRVLTGVYMALTCVATLGMGEHYVIDLVLAVPFARSIWAGVHRQWKVAGIATIVVVIWLVAFHRGWTVGIPLAAAWILTVLTIVPFAAGRGVGQNGKLRKNVRRAARWQASSSGLHSGGIGSGIGSGCEARHRRDTLYPSGVNCQCRNASYSRFSFQCLP